VKQVIKIDRRTIKKNPNGGNNFIVIKKGYPEFTLKADIATNKAIAHYNKFEESKYQYQITKSMICYSLSFSLGSCGLSKVELDGVFTGRTIPYKTIKKLFGDCIISVDYNKEVLRSMTPEPLYFYRYTNPFVFCTECGKKQKLKRLDTVESFDSDGFEFTMYDVCGNCGLANSVDVEYEKIENAIK